MDGDAGVEEAPLLMNGVKTKGTGGFKLEISIQTLFASLLVLLLLLGILAVFAVHLARDPREHSTCHKDTSPSPAPSPSPSPSPSPPPPSPSQSPAPAPVPAPAPAPAPAPEPIPTPRCEWLHYKLPNWTLPEEYRMDLDVSLTTPFMVLGKVEIDLSVLSETYCVLIHAQNMDISNAVILDTGEEGSIALDTSQRRIMIEFPSNLPMPNCTLAITFNYTLSEDNGGFYQTTFEDEDGETKIMGCTQFEDEYARMAFPCFDEPGMKARFAVNLTAPAGVSCVSNMPEDYSLANGSAVKHIFSTSPRMSTHLVAWAIGKLDSVRREIDTMDGQKAVTIWATHNRQEELEPALEMVSSVIPYYEELLKVPYPLPKLDLVALPNLQKFPAVHNWGMIAMREAELLLNHVNSSSQNWNTVSITIAREVSQQWFGGLVTMEWWDNLWLNEGFATYLENIGAARCLPNSVPFGQFFSRSTEQAFDTDSKSVTHALVLSDEETVVDGKLRDIFDDISSHKGASVLRTLHAYMQHLHQPGLPAEALLQVNPEEDDLFLKGLHGYLIQYQFGNARTQDMWGAVANYTGLPMSRWMDQWTYHPGYPVVSVNIDDNSKEFIVNQQPEGREQCIDGDTWWIPLVFWTQANPTPSWTILDSCNPQILGKVANPNDYIIVNFGRLGYYRVDYSDRTFKPLLAAASRKDSPVMADDIVGLLSDAFDISYSHPRGIVGFMELSKALGVRLDQVYLPWKSTLPKLRKMAKLINHRNTTCSAKFTNFVRKSIVGPILSTIFSRKHTAASLNSIDYNKGMLHQLVLYEAVLFEDQTAVQMGLAVFRQQGGDVPPDFREGAYSAAAAFGGEEDYSKLKTMLFDTLEVHERNRLLSALTKATSPNLVKETLSLALTKYVKSQDTVNFLAQIAERNDDAANMALSFIKTHYKVLYEKLGSWEYISKILQEIATNLGTPEQLEEFQAFVDQLSGVLVDVPYMESALESINQNIEWTDKNLQVVCGWIDNQTADEEHKIATTIY